MLSMHVVTSNCGVPNELAVQEHMDKLPYDCAWQCMGTKRDEVSQNGVFERNIMMTEALRPETVVEPHPGQQHENVVHLELLRRGHELRHRVEARVGLRHQLAGHLRRQGEPVLVLLHLRTVTRESSAASKLREPSKAAAGRSALRSCRHAAAAQSMLSVPVHATRRDGASGGRSRTRPCLASSETAVVRRFLSCVSRDSPWLMPYNAGFLPACRCMADRRRQRHDRCLELVPTCA